MRRAWLFGLLLLIGFLSGCSDDSGKVERSGIVNTDLVALKRMINVPADVKRCEWQTGKLGPHGGDWWLAAVFDVDAERTPEFLRGSSTTGVFETPPGFELTSSFAILKSLPHAQTTESQRLRLITETYGVGPYARSPLLNGEAIRLSATQILILLWTN